ncbi:MAG: sulfotransferase, partial [Candidatus Electrothrix sp. ATG2]|nr:sulfotransferase [Candidatus Electrothrix sp. ATG2]
MKISPGDSFMINKVTRKDRDSHFVWKEWKCNWIKRMVNPTGQKPFWILGRGVGPYTECLQYLDYWFESLPAGWRRPVLATVFSYFCANFNRPARPKMWVEKTPGNEFRVDQILDLFPGAKFVHIVREPRENMASLKKLYQSRFWNWNPSEIARTIGRSCRSAISNQKRMGSECYKVINYEHLTEKPEEVMRNIADFSEVGWENMLLKPT